MELLNFWVILFIPTGLILGSFFNVCIYRLPRKISVIWPGSFCPSCRKTLAWWQNVPIVSFLILKGRCFYCHEKIPRRYPFVEFITTTVTLSLLFHFHNTGTFLFYLLFFSGMIVIGGIDMFHQRIPNTLIITFLIMGIILNYLFQLNSWSQALAGILLAILFTLILRWSTTYFFRKESLGLGDIKLSALMGFYLGFELFLISLFVGSLFGIIFQLYNRRYHQGLRMTQIPLAPFLGIGAYVVIIFYL